MEIRLDPKNINIQFLDNDNIEIILKNITTPYAKIFSDVLYNKIPTMAIDKILVNKNTSSIPYELIAQRIALIPINADSDEFEYFDGVHTQYNTIVFRLKKSGSDLWETLPQNIYGQTNLYSGDMVWIPFENDRLINDPPKPSDNNFVIIKLLQNQEVDFICYALKGRGQDHTKFSPVTSVIYSPIEEVSKPTMMMTMYPNLMRKIQNESFTVNDLNILYPLMDYKYRIGLKGQLSAEKIVENAINITNNIMDLPYSERKKDIDLPGYLY